MTIWTVCSPTFPATDRVGRAENGARDKTGETGRTRSYFGLHKPGQKPSLYLHMLSFILDE